MRRFAPALVAAPMLALAGCSATFDYDGLRAFDTGGTGFEAALSREYRALALYEADEMHDWPDAAHFGAKAFAAADRPVAPENPGDWRLPRNALGAIAAAHARLSAALDRGARNRLPETAALAQARYDCRLEQQEENWQTEHIARCRDAFFANLDAIEAVLAAARTDGKGTPLVPAALGDGSADTEPRAFLVFFDFDSSALGDEALAVVSQIAGAAGSGESVRILVGGHADRAGTDAYNQSLSWRRAGSVRDALIANGVASGPHRHPCLRGIAAARRDRRPHSASRESPGRNHRRPGTGDVRSGAARGRRDARWTNPFCRICYQPVDEVGFG